MLFAGSAQMSIFGLISYYIYALVRWILSRRDIPGTAMRYIWFPLAGVILGVFIAAIQLIPTVELVSFTERAGQLSKEFRSTGSWLDFTRLGAIFAFPLIGDVGQVLHYGSSVLYVGFIPGMLLMCCMLYGWRENRIRVHLITGIILVLIAMGTRNPFNMWMAEVPPFDKLRYFGRFAGFASWHFLTASGLWLASFLEKHPAGKLDWHILRRTFGAPLLWIAILLIIFSFANKLSVYTAVGLIFAIIQLIVMVLFVRRAKLRFHLATIAAIFSILLAIPLGNLFQVYTKEYKRVLGTYKALAAERPGGRFFMEGEGPLISLEGHGPLFLTPYRTIKGFAGGNAGTMAGLNVLSGFSPLKLYGWQRRVLDSLDSASDFPHVRELTYPMIKPDYVVKRDDKPMDGYTVEGNVVLDGIAEDGRLYKSLEQQPIFYFADEISEEESLSLPFGEIITLIKFSLDGKATSLMAKPRRELNSSEGHIERFKRTKHGYVITGEFKGDCFLVILDSWYTGWHAYLDGEETPIYCVDIVFRGVKVTDGHHTIEFHYRPKGFRTGMIISIISLLISLLLIAIPSGKRVSLVR
jgi:hypothetical protein